MFSASKKLVQLMAILDAQVIDEHLQSVSLSSQEALFRELLEQNERGMTPLHVAVELGDIAKVRVLLKHGSSIDAKMKNKTVETFAKELSEHTKEASHGKIYALIRSMRY